MTTNITLPKFNMLLALGLFAGTAQAQLAPDTSFGTNGVVATPFITSHWSFYSPSSTGSFNFWHTGQVLVHNNKILVCGPTPTQEWKVQRYLLNGTPDPSFGTNGTVTTPMPGATSNAAAYSLVVQPDGKVVVSGSVYNGIHQVWALARYTDRGVLDPTFGTGGIATPASLNSAPASALLRVVLLPNGNLLAAATHERTTPMQLLRLLPSGAPDTSYGPGGFSQNTYTNFYDLTSQPDGKVILVHSAPMNFTLGRVRVARLTATGAPDPSFGTNGEVGLTHYTTFPNNPTPMAQHTLLYSTLVQPDGKLVFAGHYVSTTANGGLRDDRPALFRLNADGSPDASFQPATALGFYHMGGIASVGLQSTGKLVLGGGIRYNEINYPILARVEPTGPLDATFANTPAPLAPAAGAYAKAVPFGGVTRYLTVLPNDQVLALETYMPNASSSNNPELRLVRYTAATPSATRPAQNAALQLQAAPQPAQGTLHLSYRLPVAAPARVVLRDQLGRTVASQPTAAGAHAAALSLAACAPGIYFCTLEAGTLRQTIRVTVGQ